MKIAKKRSLTLVDELLKETSYKFTYAYEDLVFIEHSDILIKFSEKKVNELMLYINREIDDDFREKIKNQLLEEANKNNIFLVYEGLFSLRQKENEEEIEVVFFIEELAY